jgi:NAD(P)-dependent dehydrogenase (short-subunit alcohol dehydrogenase family)
MRVLVTGANRGIGLGLARHYAADGAEVHGTARDPGSAEELREVPGVTVHRLDVRDEAQSEALAKALGPGPLDLLIHNAGIASGWEDLDGFVAKVALDVLHTNAVAPLLVTRALLPALKKARGKVVHVSSGMGSISDNGMGGSYAYRMSKAALGMAAKTLAIELKSDGVTSIVIEPGWVKTDMGGAGAPLDVETSVAQMTAVIEKRGLESTGKFFKRTGEELPW